tara:strand:+ start:652 stop:861 length:210 start_codon:yes stop_codon:yes gene_type:complete
MNTLSTKPECQIFKRDSCIQDLKELVEYLTDRDVNIKDNLIKIKAVLRDKTIETDVIKIRKIKQILKNG